MKLFLLIVFIGIILFSYEAISHIETYGQIPIFVITGTIYLITVISGLLVFVFYLITNYLDRKP